MVGGPAKSGAQIGELNSEPAVGLKLAGAVPQGQDVGFAPGEVPRVGGPRFRTASPLATSCSSANWRIVSSIEYRVRPDDRSATNSDLRTSASSRSRMANLPIIGATTRAGALRPNPPANTERRSRNVFWRRRDGRRTTPPRGAVFGGVQAAPGPDQQPEPLIETITHLAGRSSTPSARPPTRWPTGSRRVCGRSPPRARLVGLVIEKRDQRSERVRRTASPQENRCPPPRPARAPATTAHGMTPDRRGW